MAYIKYFTRLCENPGCASEGERRKYYARGVCLNCYKRRRWEELREELPTHVNPKTGKPYTRKYAKTIEYNRLGYTAAERMQDSSLRKSFGVTLEQYRAMPQECAICGAGKCQTGRNLSVDHDHRTGAVRGLLCGKCNHGLGQFNDDPALLSAAIEYLKRNA
jgi:hypothetical protein